MCLCRQHDGPWCDEGFVIARRQRELMRAVEACPHDWHKVRREASGR